MNITISSLLKELHKIVNQAIVTRDSGDDEKESKRFDLSQLDLESLRDEFSKKAKRKASALQDIRKIIEDKLALMLKDNPQRMDYYKKYGEIIADYNREKDRITRTYPNKILNEILNYFRAMFKRSSRSQYSKINMASRRTLKNAEKKQNIIEKFIRIGSSTK